jgi:hypothetical protein
MIFIIPLILGAAALATAALGIGAGAAGLSDMEEARTIGEEAQKRHDRAVYDSQQKWQTTQKLAEEYGQLQLNVKRLTIGRFIDFIERIGQGASQSDKRYLKELEGFSVEQIKEYKAAALEAEKFATGGFKALGAAAAAGQGTVGLIGLFGTASTGTAISGLSGIAASNATLAWLGGGSLAAGGGGMALGTLVLGGITVGPALLIGGFVLAGQGEKALTQARAYEAEANIKIAEINTAIDFLRQVQRRIIELEDLLRKLNNRALIGLNELESRPFDSKRDAKKFQQVILLIKALAEIMKTPVLDSQGKLNPATAKIKAKYGYI